MVFLFTKHGVPIHPLPNFGGGWIGTNFFLLFNHPVFVEIKIDYAILNLRYLRVYTEKIIQICP